MSEERVRGFTQRNRNFLDYIVDASNHIVIPKAKNAKAALFDQLGAPIIFSLLIQVMASIQLNYKCCFRACKVYYEVSDRELSAETKLSMAMRGVNPLPSLTSRSEASADLSSDK